MRIFNAVKADGNGRVFGNRIAAYLGIDAGVFHMAMEYGSSDNHLKYLDGLSREKSTGSAASECIQRLVLGLNVLNGRMASDHNYIHACQTINPKKPYSTLAAGASTTNHLGVEHWYVCPTSRCVKAKLVNASGHDEQHVELSLWTHPDALAISEGWATDAVDASASEIVTRPITHELELTITPGIELFREPCSIGIEMAGSMQFMHRAQLNMHDTGRTRLLISESFKVAEFHEVFAQAKCFGLLVFQANEKKWAQFFPQMQGYETCSAERYNEDFLPPANAA